MPCLENTIFFIRRRPIAPILAAILYLVVPCGPAAADADGEFGDRRARMIGEIVAETHLTSGWIGKTRLDPRVLAVMASVPRHHFVPEPLVPFAYLNRPLPVGHGQTVSQPYIVALMTDLAEIGEGDAVLLVGLGGGYHAAILERLAGKVHCVEMQPPVAAAALNRLNRHGFTNVVARTDDPYYGWRGGTKRFDAIIVRQAMDFIPRALINQLKPGGRLVIPAGASPEMQNLTLARKKADGSVVEKKILPVRFTRMPGGPRI